MLNLVLASHVAIILLLTGIVIVRGAASRHSLLLLQNFPLEIVQKVLAVGFLLTVLSLCILIGASPIEQAWLLEKSIGLLMFVGLSALAIHPMVASSVKLIALTSLPWLLVVIFSIAKHKQAIFL